MKITCQNKECEYFKTDMNANCVLHTMVLCEQGYERQILALQQELQEKERQIERMKNCQNCRYDEWSNKCFGASNPCKNWEIYK